MGVVSGPVSFNYALKKASERGTASLRLV